MPYCPKCGALAPEDANFCSNCGSILRPQQPIGPPLPRSMPSPSVPPYPPESDVTRTYARFGYMSALISLLIMPEIFGPVAIFIGNLVRRRGGRDGTRILILGIACMIVGLFVTAIFSLFFLLPQ